MEMKMKSMLGLVMMTAVAITSVSCSDDDNKSGNELGFNLNTTETPLVDNETYAANTTETNYKSKTFGQAAVDGCETLVGNLERANLVIATAKLNSTQEEYLQKVLENLVDNVIVPTYTKLADNTSALESELNGLDVNTITQEDLDNACNSFKEARKYWEQSEAFLGGAASDFDVDPTIDSWPLNRALLLNYFNSGTMDEDMLDDASILGFHALEFILFRNGQPRKVEELKGNDTYKGFTGVSGAKELLYAQQVCKLLKERTFQLQVAWEGETTTNAERVQVVKTANLKYKTEFGLSFGDNMKKAGATNSTFATIKAECNDIETLGAVPDTLKVTVYGEVTPDFNVMMGEDARLNVYVVEDSLVARQLDNGRWISGYVHNGVYWKFQNQKRRRFNGYSKGL